jgi:hypothetical protein
MEEKTTILSEEAIAEFKRVYHSEFNEVLSEDQAKEMALRVLRLFDLLSQGEREPSAGI